MNVQANQEIETVESTLSTKLDGFDKNTSRGGGSGGRVLD